VAQRLSAREVNRITSTIIESAIRIHRTVGPGILEKAYFGCLCYELVSAGLKIETQIELPLLYEGVKIDCAYRADLIVEETVIVEVKAIESLAPIHNRQLLTYLRIGHLPVGLLLNFGALSMKLGINQACGERFQGVRTSTSAISANPAFQTAFSSAELPSGSRNLTTSGSSGDAITSAPSLRSPATTVSRSNAATFTPKCAMCGF
jgi:GxxExxY protein